MSQDRPNQIDVHGMNPRTHKYETFLHKGTIVVVVPLTHLRGYADRCYHNMRFALSYELADAGFANTISLVQTSLCGRDYETPCERAEISVNHATVIESINHALLYFKYVSDFLADNKDHPISYELYARNQLTAT